ncbi:MAG: NAD-dependent epimerase/dehydratase family protein [Bacteroidales bacterium]|nr:NAD-dependent epimerase/dehydratase family protein [Bacteroidales bacterium]
MMKKVLVTGATGMLGSRLVFDLFSLGVKVRAIYRSQARIDIFRRYIKLYGGDPERVVEWVEWCEADLLNFHEMKDALEGVEMVYHCAAMVSFYLPDRSEMLRINVNGTGNLVNACLETGVKRICHVSSIAALGKAEGDGPIDETATWIPEEKHSGYSIAKFHSEMEIWRGVEEGLKAIIVNPSVIIGPGDWKNGSSAFYGQLARGLRFYSSGATGFVDVRDVSAAMLLLTHDENFLQACGNRFLLNAANLSYREFFTKIALSINAKVPTLPVTNVMLSLAWRLAFLAGKVTGNKPQITQETALSASKKATYNGSRICREYGFTYRPIDESIIEIGKIYLTDTTR